MAELRGVVARNPNFTDAWSLLGEVEEQAGEPAAAIRSYQRAIGLSRHWLPISRYRLRLR